MLPYSYRYVEPSAFEAGRLRLATFAPGADEHPYFFSGRLIRPRRAADLLRGLMSVVQARYHLPATMLSRMLAAADPVVTCSDDRLRFEGFSGCCGAYVRVDLLPPSVDGESFGRGTTNVDFNAPMLAALATIRDRERVRLDVGSAEVRLSRGDQPVVEKKVDLPMRWLRGFVEVQACQSRMMRMHVLRGVEAHRFLRSLPRMKTNRRETYLVAAGAGVRLSQVAAESAVRVGGLERLRVLEGLAAQADELRIYGDAVTGASAWELCFDDCRFHLVVSPEVWRGFSGEGQALSALAAADRDRLLPLVRARLKWQSVIAESEWSSDGA
ncbi:MAG: hypothetical protein AB7O38_16875, partial [Pirellulaceae bacterium]